jgi:hypothetical protein
VTTAKPSLVALTCNTGGRATYRQREQRAADAEGRNYRQREQRAADAEGRNYRQREQRAADAEGGPQGEKRALDASGSGSGCGSASGSGSGRWRWSASGSGSALGVSRGGAHVLKVPRKDGRRLRGGAERLVPHGRDLGRREHTRVEGDLSICTGGHGVLHGRSRGSCEDAKARADDGRARQGTAGHGRARQGTGGHGKEREGTGGHGRARQGEEGTRDGSRG